MRSPPPTPGLGEWFIRLEEAPHTRGMQSALAPVCVRSQSLVLARARSKRPLRSSRPQGEGPTALEWWLFLSGPPSPSSAHPMPSQALCLEEPGRTQPSCLLCRGRRTRVQSTGAQPQRAFHTSSEEGWGGAGLLGAPNLASCRT